MTTTIPPQFEKIVEEKVKSGRYSSVSEILLEALELWEQRERLKAQQTSEVEAKLIEGAKQLERGEAVSGEEVYRELKRRIEERRQTQHA